MIHEVPPNVQRSSFFNDKTYWVVRTVEAELLATLRMSSYMFENKSKFEIAGLVAELYNLCDLMEATD